MIDIYLKAKTFSLDVVAVCGECGLRKELRKGPKMYEWIRNHAKTHQQQAKVHVSAEGER